MIKIEEVDVNECSVTDDTWQPLGTLKEYVSTSEEESDDVASSSTRKRRKKVDKRWQKEQVFANKELAEQAIHSEEMWSFYHKNVDKAGNVNNIYRCNKVKYRGEQCQAGVYLSYPSHTTEIILYRSQLPHTCAKLPTKSKIKISETVKNEIKELLEFDSTIKPRRIMQILAEKKLDVPNVVDINNHLASLRKQKLKTHTLSLGELEQFFIVNSGVLEDQNQGFVVSYKIEYNQPSYFRFFVSTKTLLQFAINAKHIHANATSKLLWQGFPILVVGTTDRNRHFHPFGLGICSNDETEDFMFLFEALNLGVEKVFSEQFCPTTLVCDASHAIQTAFKRVFGEEKLIMMCYSRMKKNVQMKAKQLVGSKPDIAEIIKDMDVLQLSKTEAVFKLASDLFIRKWQEQAEFVAYFKKEWLDINQNWFEGCSADVPSTNDALEGFNRVIKNENTLRERFSVEQFSVMLMQYLETWSKSYTTNVKAVNMQPIIDIDLWTKAYQWAKLEKTIITEETPDYYVYFSPSKDNRECGENDLKRNKEINFYSFDDYKVVMFIIWTTSLPKDQDRWMDGMCDCPAYFKKGICKHIVGVAIRMKIATPPAAAKTIPGSGKRPRGRGKARKVLIIQ